MRQIPKVAMIDDGVHLSNTDWIDNYSQYKARNGMVMSDPAKYSSYNHGTICANIMQKFLSVRIELISINIKDTATCGNVEDMDAAICWCAKNGIQLINLSCGTTNLHDGRRLRRNIKFFSKNHGIIVAAQSNRNVKTYPAKYSETIGVSCIDSCCDKEVRVLKRNYLGIDVQISGNHSIVIGGKSMVTPSCNSFATPAITGICANLLFDGSNEKKEMMRKIEKIRF